MTSVILEMLEHKGCYLQREKIGDYLEPLIGAGNDPIDIFNSLLKKIWAVDVGKDAWRR
jgi:hypothetical protein